MVRDEFSAFGARAPENRIKRRGIRLVIDVAPCEKLIRGVFTGGPTSPPRPRLPAYYWKVSVTPPVG